MREHSTLWGDNQMSESRSLVMDIASVTVTVVYAEAHLSYKQCFVIIRDKEFSNFRVCE